MPVTLESCLGLTSSDRITSWITLFLLSNVRSWKSEMLRRPHALMTASKIFDKKHILTTRFCPLRQLCRFNPTLSQQLGEDFALIFGICRNSPYLCTSKFNNLKFIRLWSRMKRTARRRLRSWQRKSWSRWTVVGGGVCNSPVSSREVPWVQRLTGPLAFTAVHLCGF